VLLLWGRHSWRRAALRRLSIAVTLGMDTAKPECLSAITPGHKFDPSWEPTSEAQKSRFAMGSVDPGELVMLRWR